MFYGIQASRCRLDELFSWWSLSTWWDVDEGGSLFLADEDHWIWIDSESVEDTSS